MSVNDYAFLLAQGVEPRNLSDMWHNYWDRTPVEGAAFNDRMWNWFKLGGYTGSLSDCYGQWVRAGRPAPSVGETVTNGGIEVTNDGEAVTHGRTI